MNVSLLPPGAKISSEEAAARAAAFDFSIDAMLLVDPHADAILEANTAACTLLGYDRAALRQTRLTALHAGQVPQLIVFTQAVMAKGTWWTTALKPRHTTGKELSLEYAGSLIPQDETPLMLLTLSDLEQRRKRGLDAVAENHMRSGIAAWQRMERVFRDIERENQLILRAAGEGIYGVNSEGKTTFVNPAAERMLGWPADELVGRDIHSIVHHTHHDGTALSARGLPDLRGVSRRRRAQGRQRGVLAQGRPAGVGGIHLHARSATAASSSAPSSSSTTSASGGKATRSCAPRSPKSIACASGWSRKMPTCRRKSASRSRRTASSATRPRSSRRCGRCSWWRRPTRR